MILFFYNGKERLTATFFCTCGENVGKIQAKEKAK